MPAVGRNDPCPCGSGRKYKNCCMRRQQLEESQQRGGGLFEKVLLTELQQFALSDRYAKDLDASFQVFWGGAYSPAGLQVLDRPSALRWLEWHVLDYRLEADRRRPIDLFREGPGRELPDDFCATLDALTDAPLGLYRVERTEPTALTLYDPLRDEGDIRVVDAVLARAARRGDILIARIYELEGARRVTPSSLLLPAEFEPGLVEYAQNAYRTYVSERGGASWHDFLRAHGHIFMAYLLSYRGEALRPLLGPGTRYHDPLTARDRLREFTRRQREEREEELRREHAAEYGEPLGTRTASGLLVLPGIEEEEGAEQEAPKRPTILLPGRDT